MAHPEIDKLIEKYDKEWNLEKRIKIVQKIDSIATREYHWAFGWAGLYGRRGLNWNRFGIPDHGLGYGYEVYKKYWGAWGSPLLLWWSDPEKKKLLEEAKKDENKFLPIEEETIDYWNILNK